MDHIYVDKKNIMAKNTTTAITIEYLFFIFPNKKIGPFPSNTLTFPPTERTISQTLS